MIDFDTPKYATPKVAAGAGIAPATLRGYYTERGKQAPKFRYLKSSPVKLAEKGGEANSYNVKSAMHVALSVELIRWGLEASAAFDAAMPILAGDDFRLPGGCYHPNEWGATLFLYSRELGEGWIAAEDAPALGDIRRRFEPVSYLTINLTSMEQRMFAALGIEGNSWDGIDNGGGDPDSGEWVPE